MRGFIASAWGGRRMWIWIPATLFLLANLVAFGIYQAVFADEAAVSQSRLDEAEAQLAELRDQRRQLERYLDRAEGTLDRVHELYESDLAPERQRLTTILREVRRLAAEANLEPQANRYQREELEAYGLAKRTFTFTVQGAYFDLRKLINSLELSEYFLTLEDVGLSETTGRSGSQLTISLRMSTLFAESSELGNQLAQGDAQGGAS